MRGIKFRGKEILSGKMVYGSYVNYYGTHYISPENDFPSFEIDPETVGQFTGKYDMNRNEIYEGDIVISELTNLEYVIKWDGIAAGFIGSRKGSYLLPSDWDKSSILAR